MTTIKNRSRIVEEMQEIFSDLKRAGVINKKQIAQFEALKNLEVKTIQPKAIKHYPLLHEGFASTFQRSREESCSYY